MSKEREPASGAPEGARRATGGAPEERAGGKGRWSAKRKTTAVLLLLRGEDLETLSRELGVTAATLSAWRDQFLAGGEASSKARETDVENEETQRLKSLVADLSMSNDLLRGKIHRLEALALCLAEVEAMSCAASPSMGQVYGVARVLRAWELARFSFYYQRGLVK